MTQEPYASARRVFWIVENGSSRRGWTTAGATFINGKLVERPHHQDQQGGDQQAA